MRIASPLVLALTLVAASSGCASAGGGSSGGGSNSDVIASEELRQYETQYANALEMVDRRRSQWLRPRRQRMSFGSPADNACDLNSPDAAQCRQTVSDQPVLPVVYLNNARYGPVESLESFSSSSIEELEFLDARDATTQFGTGVEGGVILVTLR